MDDRGADAQNATPNMLVKDATMEIERAAASRAVVAASVNMDD